MTISTRADTSWPAPRLGFPAGLAVLAAITLALLTVVPLARAASQPVIASSRVTDVTSTSANLRAEIDPSGIPSTYRFEYIGEAAYEANLAAVPPRDGFSGAAVAPPSGAAPLGAGSGYIAVVQHLAGLAPATGYRYRVSATNSAGTAHGLTGPFGTQAPTNVFALLDGRGWEMVSPIDKDGGAVGTPGGVFGGGVFQAAADGNAVTFSAADSFGAAQGAPAGSQYLAVRAASGWLTANLSTPLLSGSYGDDPDGVPYQLFAPDLSGALMSNGERCRGESGGECPVANPPLPGSGAPAGYRDYYGRTGAGDFRSLLTGAELTYTSLSPSQFELRLVAASPDLAHVVLSSCAALTANAIEVPSPDGCDPAAQNLYQWSATGLDLINVLPGEADGTPGAAVAAQSAVSTDGSRVYFTEGGDLYLREGAQSKVVDAGVGGEGTFQTASSAGSVAFFTKAGHLYRYLSSSGAAVDLTPSGEVEGVFGAAADGSDVYYGTATGLYLWSGGETTEIATGAAAAGDYPPTTGTARVTADGSHLLFLSSAELTGYPSEGATEVFLYGAAQPGAPAVLTCVSCNPAGEAPAGSSSIPGALANGTSAAATALYKPRSLSAAGTRVFFDSEDSLVPQDTNQRPDVYEWEAAGTGSCTRAGGCVDLISGGRDPEPSRFIDASADGSDAFFITAASLYPLDPGSDDVYDARIGGGFALSPMPIPCISDACQILPEAPEDPSPGTLVHNAGNPPLSVSGEDGKHGKRHKKRHHPKRKHRHHKHHKKQHHKKQSRGGRR